MKHPSAPLNATDYIAADKPSAPVRMDELFSEAAARSVAHPKMGKAGKLLVPAS